MGDLYLEPGPHFMELWEEARVQQVCLSVSTERRVAEVSRVIQRPWGLHKPPWFKFLDRFGTEAAAVTGNHDLEGDDYETDEANLQMMGQRHYQAARVEPVLGIGLSTVRSRSNAFRFQVLWTGITLGMVLNQFGF